MNKTFKVIWNHSTQTWTAVSELAGTRRKSKSIKLTAISAALLMACGTAQAATHTAADDFIAISHNEASPLVSTSDAEKPQVLGKNAIAAGRKAKAETNNSVAIGPSAEVLRQLPTDYNSNGIAIGAQARIEPKVNGNAETSIFHNSIAIGTRTLATANHAVVIGHNASSMRNQGAATYQTGENIVAIGNNARADWEKSIAIGNNSSTVSPEAIAVGSNSMASGGGNKGGVAIGSIAHANHVGTVALGSGSNASNVNSMAMGFKASSVGQNTVTVGPNAFSKGNNTVTIGDGAMSGWNSANRAVTVGANAHTVTDDGLSVGYNAFAGNSRSTAIGKNAVSYGAQALALGSADAGGGVNNASPEAAYQKSTMAIGNNSSALGTNSIATGNNNIAFGTGATAGVAQASVDGIKTAYADYRKAYETYANLDKTAENAKANAGALKTIVADLSTNLKTFYYNYTDAGVLYKHSKEFQAALKTAGLSFEELGTLTNEFAKAADTSDGNIAKVLAKKADIQKFADITDTQVGGKNERLAHLVSLAKNLNNKITELEKANEAAKTATQALTNGKAAHDAAKTDFEKSYAGKNATNAIAIGASSETASNSSTAVGHEAKVHGTSPNAVAIGKGASAGQSGYITREGTKRYFTTDAPNATAVGASSLAALENSTAVGYDNMVRAKNAGAFGAKNRVGQMKLDASGADTASATPNGGEGSFVVGYNSRVWTNNVMVLGNNVSVRGDTPEKRENAVVLGNNSDGGPTVKKVNSANVNGMVYSGFKGNLGATKTDGSEAEKADNELQGRFVSIGAATTDKDGATVYGERQIKHVAAGEISSTSTDAINGSQLYAVASGLRDAFPVVYTDADGNKVVKYPDGKYYPEGTTFDADGNPSNPPVTNVIASMNNGDNKTNEPMQLANVGSNLPTVNDTTKQAFDPNSTTPKDGKDNKSAPITADEAAAIAKKAGNNAATVSDVLNAGWNLKNNDEARDFVKPYDTVNFVNGIGTTAVVETDDKASTSNVTFNVDMAEITPESDGSVTGPVPQELLDALDAAQAKVDENPDDEEAKKALEAAQDAVNKAGGNKVANAQNVADMINSSGFTLKADKTEGDNLTAADLANGEMINPGDTITMKAGKNMSVKHEKDGSITYATKDDVSFNTVNVGDNTYVDENGKPVTKDGDKYKDAEGNPVDAAKVTKLSPVAMKAEKAKPATNNGNKAEDQPTTALNVSSSDGKPTQITGVGSTLNVKPVDTNPNGTATTGDARPNLVDLVGTKDAPVNKNAAATVGDLQNMGWVVSTNDGKDYKDVVKNADQVDFKGTGLATVTGETKNGIRTITVNVDAQKAVEAIQTPVVYTNKDGNKLVKVGDKFYKAGDVVNGKPKDGAPEVPKGDVIASMNNGDNNTSKPMQLANVGSNLPTVNDTTKQAFDPNSTEPKAKKDNKSAPITAKEAADIVNKAGNNAATVSDVLNAGWNLQNNGEARDFVKPYDTVNFVNGKGTKAVVETADNLTSTVKFDVDAGEITADKTKPGAVKGPVTADEAKKLADDLKKAEQAVKDLPADATEDKKAEAQKALKDAQDAAAPLNKVATAQNVAEAINNSGWRTNSTTATGGAKDTLINPGKAVNFESGKNMKVAQTVDKDGNVAYTYATKDDVQFNSVQLGGDNGPKLTNDGKDLKVSGSNGTPVKITNVADGNISADSKDAVNGSQLHATNQSINRLGDTVNNIGGNVTRLSDKVDNMDRDYRAGIAGSNAAASLPQVYLPGKSMVAAAAGTFKGQNALAVGYSSISDNGKLIWKAQANLNSRADVGVGVGMGYLW